MHGKDLKYKIDKYNYKLEHSSTMRDHNVYKKKLDFYQSKYKGQFGGADESQQNQQLFDEYKSKIMESLTSIGEAFKKSSANDNNFGPIIQELEVLLPRLIQINEINKSNYKVAEFGMQLSEQVKQLADEANNTQSETDNAALDNLVNKLDSLKNNIADMNTANALDMLSKQ